jgi:hypothetical protein
MENKNDLEIIPERLPAFVEWEHTGNAPNDRIDQLHVILWRYESESVRNIQYENTMIINKSK